MGNSNSGTEQQTIPVLMDRVPNYPDMNDIFKSIPKMMQVADDMHRMTNYIMDLRNMTFGLSIISFFGMIVFLLLKYAQNKHLRRRRRYYRNTDSEQSSLNQNNNTNNGISGTLVSSKRHCLQKHNPYHLNHSIDWNSTLSRHVPIDMEKLVESQNSNFTSTALILNGNVLNRHQASPIQVSSLINNHQRNHTAVEGNTNNGTVSLSSNATTNTVALHDSVNGETTDYCLLALTTIPNSTFSNSIVTSTTPLVNSSICQKTSVENYGYHTSYLNYNNNQNIHNQHHQTQLNGGIKVSDSSLKKTTLKS